MSEQVKQTDGAEENRLSPASDLPGLNAAERASIERQSRPNAALIHETIRAEGESELQRSATALLLSGLASGLSMGFSLIVEALLRAHLPEAGWTDLVSRLGYTVGFLIVVLGRQQLFTENTLTPVLPLLLHRNGEVLVGLLRLWALVLVANVAGAWIIAAVLAHTSLLDPDVAEAAAKIAHHAFEPAAGQLFLKGIFAGWLIALMAWLLPAVDGSRPFIVLLITYVVALGSFSHVIAGSVDMLYLRETGIISFGEYVTHFFLPTLAGNTLGGVALVAGLNYGQVAHEVEG